MDDDQLENWIYNTWLSLMAKENVAGNDRLSDAEQIFRCVYWLNKEVYNGGFDQYFFNSTGDYANEAVNSLVHVGAPVFATIVHEAILNTFPSGTVPTDWTERQISMREDESYHATETILFDRYCKEAEDVYPLLYTLAERHGFLVT